MYELIQKDKGRINTQLSTERFSLVIIVILSSPMPTVTLLHPCMSMDIKILPNNNQEAKVKLQRMKTTGQALAAISLSLLERTLVLPMSYRCVSQEFATSLPFALPNGKESLSIG